VFARYFYLFIHLNIGGIGGSHLYAGKITDVKTFLKTFFTLFLFSKRFLF